MAIGRYIPLILLGLALAPSCNRGRDQLLAAFQSPLPQERALAVKRLSDLGRPEDLVLVTRAAKDPVALVRRAAAEALGGFRDQRLADQLSELLQDPDESVQATAAASLGAMKLDKANSYLTLHYGQCGPSVRQAIIRALNTAGVPNAMAQAVASESKSRWERNWRALWERSASERIAAAEELGKSGRPEAVDRLLELLNNSPTILAAAAARGLGQAGDARVAPDILKLLAESSPDLRVAACESLRRLQYLPGLPQLESVAVERSSASPVAVAAILGLPRGEPVDQTLCRVAMTAAPMEALAAGREMRERGGCPLGALLRRLSRMQMKTTAAEAAPAAAGASSADVSVALEAVEALGPTAKEALPAVLALFRDRDRAVRAGAVEAAAAIGDPSATLELRHLYDRELGELKEQRADWIPGPLPLAFVRGFEVNLETPTGITDGAGRRYQELWDRLRTLREARAPRSNLSATADPAAPTELVDDVQEEQLRLFAAVIRALGRLHAEGAAQILKLHLNDPSPLVRSGAYVGLAYLGSDGIAEAHAAIAAGRITDLSTMAQALAAQGKDGRASLQTLLGQKQANRTKVLEVLLRSNPDALPADSLIELLREDGPEAPMAASLLGASRSNGATDALLRYLSQPRGLARRQVLQALGKIGERRTAATIANDLFSDDPEIRAAAAEAVGSTGGPAEVESLQALKGDYYREVRESAERALHKLGK